MENNPFTTCGSTIGFAKADARATLPAKVPANIKNIKLLREAYHDL